MWKTMMNTGGIIALIFVAESLQFGEASPFSFEDGQEAVGKTLNQLNKTIGEMASLKCLLSGLGETTWKFKQKDAFGWETIVNKGTTLHTPDPKYSSDGHQLNISSVTTADTGLYSCNKEYIDDEYSIYLSVNARTRPLKTEPQNMSVISGGEARFQCGTDSHGRVWWIYIPFDRPGERIDVYINGELVGDYATGGRHAVVRSRQGQYDLVITDVQPDDAGKYMCWGDDGFGTKGVAELTVLAPIRSSLATPLDPLVSCGSNVPSEGVVVENDLGIGLEPDKVELSCQVRYRGNIPPKLQWSNNSIDLESNVTSDSDGVIVYRGSVGTLSLTSNSTPYVCRIEGIPESTSDNSRTCAVDNIPLLYISRPYISYNRNELECIYNTSFSNVSIKWIDSDTGATVSNASILHLFSGPTKYVQCIAEWYFRNKLYSLKSLIGAVHLKENQKEENVTLTANTTYTAIFVCAIVLPLIVVTLVVTRMLCRKRIKKFRYSNKSDKDQENKTLCNKVEDRNNMKDGEAQSMV